MATCCSVLGIIGLVLTDLAVIIAFATPYWIEYRIELVQGLWANCKDDQCTWIFDDNYLTESFLKESWFIAVQGLVAGGLGLGILCLLLATIALCCDCRGCNSSSAIGWLLIFGFLSLSVAAVVFGVCAHKYGEVQIEFGYKYGRKFGWAFWLNAGAAGAALLTGLIYIVDGSSRKD